MRSLFITQYLKNIRSVGAVAPSSRFLADKMLESIDFERAKVIVEYGPGTGVFTSQLQKRIKPGTKVIVIETNLEFNKILQHTFRDSNDIDIVSDSAENIKTILKKRGVANPDYIISGLPFAALPAEVSRTILKSTSLLLGDKGTFITFQYTLLKRDLLASYFADIKITRELRNIPPAYVLTCKNRVN